MLEFYKKSLEELRNEIIRLRIEEETELRHGQAAIDEQNNTRDGEEAWRKVVEMADEIIKHDRHGANDWTVGKINSIKFIDEIIRASSFSFPLFTFLVEQVPVVIFIHQLGKLGTQKVNDVTLGYLIDRYHASQKVPTNYFDIKIEGGALKVDGSIGKKPLPQQWMHLVTAGIIGWAEENGFEQDMAIQDRCVLVHKDSKIPMTSNELLLMAQAPETSLKKAFEDELDMGCELSFGPKP